MKIEILKRIDKVKKVINNKFSDDPVGIFDDLDSEECQAFIKKYPNSTIIYGQVKD